MTLIVITRSTETGSQQSHRFEDFEEFKGGMKAFDGNREIDIIELRVPLADLPRTKEAMDKARLKLTLTKRGSDIDALHLAEQALEGAVKGAGAGAGVGIVGSYLFGSPPPVPPVDPATVAALAPPVDPGTVAVMAKSLGIKLGIGKGAGLTAASTLNPAILICGAIGLAGWAGIKIVRAVRDAPKVMVFAVQPSSEPGYTRLLNSLFRPSTASLAPAR